MNESKGILFKLQNYYARGLDSIDGTALQALLERCTDYFQLVSGTSTWPSAAQTLFTQLPEGKSYDDKFVIGIYGESGNLIGVLDAIRDHPAFNEWYLGLLLLEPLQRNRGLGEQLYQAFEHWVTQFDARHIHLGVVEQNEKGYRFWQRMGFEMIEKNPSQRFGEKDSVTIVMRRSLAGQLVGKARQGIKMEFYDDDLIRFEADGAVPLLVANDQGYVEHDDARIWYATYGSGSSVILLHGGLGHSGNWGYQVPALVSHGYRAVLIDSRGHGRSTRDTRPYTYGLLASDVLAVMDALRVEKAALVGWSDGACTALTLASQSPARVSGVFFFACNMDPSGAKEFEFTPTVKRCFDRHVKDYEQLSPAPDQFDKFSEAVGLMQRTQPNYSARDLAQLSVPVAIIHSEHDEFIKRDHAEYLARSIPNAEFIYLPGVSHFAPLQRPERFNSTMLAFLGRVLP